MFIPKMFKVEEAADILDFIQKNGFATLISVNSDGLPIATRPPEQAPLIVR